MGFLAAILASVLWGAELALMKVMMDRGVPWPVVGVYTYAGSALLVLAYGLARRRIARAQLRAAWPWLVLIGLVGATINAAAIKGIELSDATNAAVIQRTQILFAMLLGWLGLKERVRPADIPAVVAMVAGFLVMQLAGGPPDGETGLETAASERRSAWLIGGLLVLASAFFLALNAMIIKRVARTTRRESIALVNTTIITCAMLGFSTARGAHIGSVWALDSGALAIAVGALAGGSLLLYYFAISHIEIWKVSALQLLTPVTAAALQICFMKRGLSGPQIAGMALILAGATLLIWLHQRRPADDASEPA